MIACTHAALAPLAVIAGALAGADVQAPHYHTHAELTSRVNRLAANHPSLCKVQSIGASREGRAIWALRLARGGGKDPDRRPAILIVAALDGDHLVGTEVAMAIGEALVENGAELLGEHTVYIVPRVNPDAAERYFGSVRQDWQRSLRPDDGDRDGAIDEDPPNDLDGDGLITMMRVFDPARADMMRDAGEPRLDVKPDRDKGERAEYTLLVEGIDDDGDGELNEDPVGGVNLNANFTHGYQEHADGAGPHQVSEPESLALIEYVLGRQNIAAVLVFGHHDNLSRPPDGKGTYPAGTPKSIDERDAGLYKHVSERFVEITGLEKVPGAPSGGAFYAWAYAEFGVPSFATPAWTRPEPDKEGGEGGEGGEEPGGAAKNADEQAWLAYADERGEGFVDWTPFEHPELGRVEIGGWAPYFRTNPPPEAIEAIAAAQIEFVKAVAGWMPDVSLTVPEVARLAPGLYEVKVALVNDGYLPTGTAMATRNRRARPHVVKLSAGLDQVLTGERINKVWSVPGSGGREAFRWIIAAPDGSPLTISVYSEKYGSIDMTVPLHDNRPPATGAGRPAGMRGAP